MEALRLQYGGHQDDRDKTDKELSMDNDISFTKIGLGNEESKAKPQKRPKYVAKHKCIENACDKLTHRPDRRCRYCYNRFKIILASKNGRPTYKTLMKERDNMKMYEMSEKYKINPSGILDWLRSYDKYNLTDL